MQIGELFFNLGFKTSGASEAKTFETGMTDSSAAVKILSDAVDHIMFLLEEMAVKMGAVTRGDIDASRELIKEEKAYTSLAAAEEKQNKALKAKHGLMVTMHQKMKVYWRSLNAARLEALALAGAVTYFVKKAADAAIHIDKISSMTGLSGDKIQRMGDAVAQTGGNIDDMAGAIRGLQQQSLDIMMGKGGNLGVYNLLGLNPHEDPIQLLNKLSVKLKQMPAALGANLAREMGLSDEMIYFLKNVQNIKPPKKETIVTELELKRLKDFGFYFNRIFEQGKRVLMRLGAFLIPVANQIVYFFDRIGTLTGKSLSAMEPFIGKIEKFAGPLKAMGALLFAALFPVTAAIVLFALVLEDIASYIAGDDSVTGRLIKQFNSVKKIIDAVIDATMFLANISTFGLFSDQLSKMDYNAKHDTNNFMQNYIQKNQTPEQQEAWKSYQQSMQQNSTNVTVNMQGVVTNKQDTEDTIYKAATNAFYQRPVNEGVPQGVPLGKAFR